MRYIVGIVLILGLTAGVYRWKFSDSGHIDVTHPVRGPAVQSIYGTGTVEATVMLPIAVRVAGHLQSLNVDEGANVTKGQVLAQLEDSDLEKNIEALDAQARFASTDFARKEALLKQGFETRANVDQARASRDAAVAAAAKARAEQDFTKFTAPADGLVIKRDGEIGQLIPANQPVFWISCCAPLRISAEIDEEDIGDVKIGQAVLIRADAFPGQIFHGTVQGITPKGDPVSRSYRVRVAFVDEVPLKIGMTAETNIIIRETKDALLIPNSAISPDNKVWRVVDGKAVSKTVKTGAHGTDQTEVKEGLTESDVIITTPDKDLKEGQTLGATKLQEQKH